MDAHDIGYNNTNGGAIYHALESNGGGLFNWERGILASLLVFPLVLGQFVAALFTVLGTGLAAAQLIHGSPVSILLTGAAIWLTLRFAQVGLAALFGGSRHRRPAHSFEYHDL